MSDFKDYSRTVEVKAYQVNDNERIATSNGPVDVNAGDYVVVDSDGKLSVIEQEQFEETYSVKVARNSKK